MKIVKVILGVIMSIVVTGCCIGSRSWKVDQEITGYRLPASGMYTVYTNDVPVYVDAPAPVIASSDGISTSNAVLRKVKLTQRVYKHCSYHTGPFAGSDVYPATRMTLNALSGWKYSSPASGDYMLNVVTVPLYPVILCNLPLQFILDTILLPWDIYAAPTCPEGYHLSR